MVADFVQRITEYPVVNSAVGQVNSYYTWAKESNTYIRSAAGLTENGVKMVAGSTQPLLHKFENRISTLDQLACKQLDKLESNYPSIRDPTDKVVERSRNYYNDALKPKVEYVLTPVTAAMTTVQQAGSYGRQKLSAVRDTTTSAAVSARDYGLEKYRRLVYSKHGQAGLQRLDQLIASIDRYVDHCLPEEEAANEKRVEGEEGQTEAEQEKCQAEPVASASQAAQVVDKLRKRMYTRAARSLLRIQEPIDFACDKALAVKDEFWTKFERLQRESIEADKENASNESENNKTAMEAAKLRLHQLHLMSTAGLQVTADHVPQQLLHLPSTVLASTEKGVESVRVGFSSFMELLQHNRFVDFVLMRAVESNDSMNNQQQQQQNGKVDKHEEEEEDELETTDDTIDDSELESSD